MSVESVPLAEALSHAVTLEVSCHSITRVLLQALESMEGKGHTSYQVIHERLHAKSVNYNT